LDTKWTPNELDATTRSSLPEDGGRLVSIRPLTEPKSETQLWKHRLRMLECFDRYLVADLRAQLINFVGLRCATAIIFQLRYSEGIVRRRLERPLHQACPGTGDDEVTMVTTAVNCNHQANHSFYDASFQILVHSH
jgi:hypothetical protein